MAKKANNASQALNLEQIPNIGPATAADLRMLGIQKPTDLRGKDPLSLYEKLNRKTGCRQDPCVLYTLRAAVDFMNGGKSKPWWKFMKEKRAR